MSPAQPPRPDTTPETPAERVEVEVSAEVDEEAPTDTKVRPAGLFLVADVGASTGGLEVFTAILDVLPSDLCIRRFTPMAEKVLNMIPTDVGEREPVRPD